MPTRRQFIKRSASAVAVSLAMPKYWLGQAHGQTVGTDRKIFVVVQFGGGNDGLNTVVPYTNSRYYSFRPTLSFKDTELKDAKGGSMIISDQFGLHPALSSIKPLYDAGKMAIILGVGYPGPDLSHFTSMDIWHTARLDHRGEGWLGKYADQALVGQPGLHAASVRGSLPRTLQSDQVVVPSIISFESFGLQNDLKYPANGPRQRDTFNAVYGRRFAPESTLGAITHIGADAANASQIISGIPGRYQSTVAYPNTTIASALKMAAQMIITIPEASLLYVSMGSFDHHGQQITPGNKLAGAHFTLLQSFSDAVAAFYDDLGQHSLADNVLMMEWSEFGRRPNENGSLGTDHGTASTMFIIGNPVHGGLFGQQPSLEATALDTAGNMKFTLDFRAVYATILDQWLGVDSQTVLGSKFENVGFLG